jgi:hypothetical protein
MGHRGIVKRAGSRLHPARGCSQIIKRVLAERLFKSFDIIVKEEFMLSGLNFQPARFGLWPAIFVLFIISVPVLAHHSFQAEYDAAKPLTLTGTVTKLEWTNPHARFYVEVKDPSGKVTTWNFELASPNVLRRLGWNRDMMKPGDVVTVKGHRAKDDSTWANANSVTLSDGRTMSAGSSADEASAAPTSK